MTARLSMYDDKNQYHLVYHHYNGDSTWLFTKLQDLFDEINRIGENKVFVELSLLDNNDTRPIYTKLWRRIHRAAKANGFIVELKEGGDNLCGSRSIGWMERK